MSIDEGVIRSIVREEVVDGLSKRDAKKPRIINKTMNVADTEYEIALPAKTKKFTIHMRQTDTAFRLSFERGRVATPKESYFTVPAKGSYWEDNLDLDEIFYIYVACSTEGKTIEAIVWS